MTLLLSLLLSVLTISTPDSVVNLPSYYDPGDTIVIQTRGIALNSVRGLKVDTSAVTMSDLDWMQVKMASSLVHFYGKGRVVVRAFSDMAKPGRASLAMCKTEVDRLMAAGVDTIVADTTLLPRADVRALEQYISRVSRAMSSGRPDNDILLYVPRFDRRIVRTIYEDGGFDMDYATASMIDSIQGVDDDGYLMAPGGMRYKALVVPNFKNAPQSMRETIARLEKRGANVVYAPDGNYADELLHNRYLRTENLRTEPKLMLVRRKEGSGQYRYLMSNLTAKTFAGWVRISIPYRSIELTDPVTGRITVAPTRRDSVYLSVRSGESVLMQTSMSRSEKEISPLFHGSETLDLSGEKWMLIPSRDIRTNNEDVWETKLETLCMWSKLWPDAVGTMRYSTVFRFAPPKKVAYHVLLSLPDLHESARITINGQEVGTLFALPYQIDITDYLVSGKNMLDIDVTSLEANYLGTNGKNRIPCGLSKVHLIIQR